MLICHHGSVHGTSLIFMLAGVVLAAVGVGGYLIERSRRAPGGVRRFLLWYVFMWPFMLILTCAVAYPRLHWLYYVAAVFAACGYIAQVLVWRRSQARSGSDVR